MKRPNWNYLRGHRRSKVYACGNDHYVHDHIWMRGFKRNNKRPSVLYKYRTRLRENGAMFTSAFRQYYPAPAKMKKWFVGMSEFR